MSMTTPWLAGTADKPQAALTLVCFGAAGSGGSQFIAWNRQLPPWLRAVAVQLPGREGRHREAPVKDCGLLAAELARAIGAQDFGHFAFFGHSFGALLAYETARALRRQGRAQPCHLCVAGRDAPHLPHGYPKTYALPEPQFIEVLRSYGGFDERILGEPELLRFFLPVLRADLEVNTEYVHLREAPLAMPITAMRGADDRVCTSERLAAWHELSTGPFTAHEHTGGHFFFRSGLRPLLDRLTSTLAPHASCPDPVLL
jgi:medium-chain acyl-[acyl-carrier-protein] hydrolase